MEIPSSPYLPAAGNQGIRDSFPGLIPSCPLHPATHLLHLDIPSIPLFPFPIQPCLPHPPGAASSLWNSLLLLLLAALPIPSPPRPQNSGGQSQGLEASIYPEALESHIPAPLQSHPAPAQWDDNDTAGPGEDFSSSLSCCQRL